MLAGLGVGLGGEGSNGFVGEDGELVVGHGVPLDGGAEGFEHLAGFDVLGEFGAELFDARDA